MWSGLMMMRSRKKMKSRKKGKKEKGKQGWGKQRKLLQILEFSLEFDLIGLNLVGFGRFDLGFGSLEEVVDGRERSDKGGS